MWNERNRPKFFKDQISGAPEPAVAGGWDLSAYIVDATPNKVEESDHTPGEDATPISSVSTTVYNTTHAPST